jgi:crotonobetainyl-CoA:carnitine CoA-transferase CaiB-like acyl-CoA transferase
MSEASALPLSGLFVVELGTSIAVPFGAFVLADLGAEVLKIERPGKGDDARLWGPPFHEGASPMFRAINRNKQSAAIDLKDKAQCDCNLSAYGATGPLRDKPGYDPLMQACGGIMSVTGNAGRDPVRVGPSIVDQGAGMWAVIGILAALNRRHQTGEGCEIGGSLYETAVSWCGMHIATYNTTGRLPQPMGTENFGIAPYKAYRAADGWLVIAAGNDALFARLALALGRPEWLDDPEFASNGERVKHRERLNRLIGEVVATAERADWLARLDGAGVPAAPLQTLDAVIAHPQTQAVGMVQPAPGDHPDLVGLPLQFDGVRPPLRSLPPELGGQTERVIGATTKKAVS